MLFPRKSGTLNIFQIGRKVPRDHINRVVSHPYEGSSKYTTKPRGFLPGRASLPLLVVCGLPSCGPSAVVLPVYSQYGRPHALRAVTDFHGRPFAVPSSRDAATQPDLPPPPYPTCVSPSSPSTTASSTSRSVVKTIWTDPNSGRPRHPIHPTLARHIALAGSILDIARCGQKDLLSAAPSPSTPFAWIRLRASPRMLTHDRTPPYRGGRYRTSTACAMILAHRG
ncbi:hypothetical protein C8R44DRAFT_823412 [Mycena epipterygia]|nr:hypothetical protein C8R44DRAFT_823412 [Mycena epipterygia]